MSSMPQMPQTPRVENAMKNDELVQKKKGKYADTCITFQTKPLGEYTGQINTYSEARQGLYLMASYGKNEPDVKFKVLLDCGAAMSLLDKKIYDRFSCRPPIDQSDKKVRLADGSCHPCEGEVELPLCIDGQMKSIKFLLGNFCDEAILGMDDLRALGLSIDFQKMLVTSGKLWFPVVDRQDSLVGRKVLVRRSVVVPKRTQVVCQANIEGIDDNKRITSEGLVMVQGDKAFVNDFGVVPAKTLHQHVDQGIPILLYNPNDEDVEISSNAVIGELKGVETVTMCPSEDIFSARTSGDVKEGELPLHVQELFQRSCENLSADEQNKLRAFMIQFADVFSKGDYDIGSTGLVKHHILTGDARPIKHPPRRMGPEARIAADELVQGLLEKGFISPSKSPWASPIVMVKKRMDLIECV